MNLRLLVPTFLVLSLGFLSAASAHSLDALEAQLFKSEPYVQFVDKPAPDFALKDADGHAVSLASFKGRVVVLWFVYTRCKDVCPLQSEKLALVQADAAITPMKKLVAFVAVTTDPVRDTPDIMRAYGKMHGLTAANWTFLTSGVDRPDDMRKLAEQYGLKFTPEGDGELMHGVVTEVIDRQGHIRARFFGLKFDELNLLTYVNALTNDYD